MSELKPWIGIFASIIALWTAMFYPTPGVVVLSVIIAHIGGLWFAHFT